MSTERLRDYLRNVMGETGPNFSMPLNPGDADGDGLTEIDSDDLKEQDAGKAKFFAAKHQNESQYGGGPLRNRYRRREIPAAEAEFSLNTINSDGQIEKSPINAGENSMASRHIVAKSSTFPIIDDFNSKPVPVDPASNSRSTNDRDRMRISMDQYSGGGASNIGIGNPTGGTFSETDLDTIVDKTGNDPNKSGHNIAERTIDSNLVQDSILTHNRFSAAASFTAQARLENKGVDSVPQVSQRQKLGKYAVNSDSTAYKDLADVGTKLLRRASIHPTSGKLKAGDVFNPFTLSGVLGEKTKTAVSDIEMAASDLKELLSNGSTDFETSEILGDLYGGQTTLDEFMFEDSGGSSSSVPGDSGPGDTLGNSKINNFVHRTMNDPANPFDKAGFDTNQFTMAAVGFGWTIAIWAAFELVTAVLSALTPEARKEYLGALDLDRNVPGIPGSSDRNQISAVTSGLLALPDINHLLGFVETSDNFFTATSDGLRVTVGMDSVFDLGSDSGLLGSLAAGLSSLIGISLNPGFWSMFFKNFLGSYTQLFRDLGNNDDGIVGFFGTIKRSRFVGWLNYFASIGDNYGSIKDAVDLFGLDGAPIDPNRGTKSGRAVLSWLDAAKLTNHKDRTARAGKSRESAKSVELAWRQGAIPSMYLLPKDTVALQYAITGEGSFRLGLKNKNFSNNYKSYIDNLRDDKDAKDSLSEEVSPSGKIFSSDTKNRRIPGNVVQMIERELDSECVPFYFHDLRTNEIISFHAFLSSLSDSYSATYDASTAYGRADAVQIYGGTARTISLSFYAIATNPQDFDEMWWKLNKLTTLMYPQYSAGMGMSLDNGTKISMPFSQVPTASPLCRIRLGDLFKSNYSRFALTRLFGGDTIMQGSGGDSVQDLYDAVKTLSAELQGKLFEESMFTVRKPTKFRVKTKGTPLKEGGALALPFGIDDLFNGTKDRILEVRKGKGENLLESGLKIKNLPNELKMAIQGGMVDGDPRALLDMGHKLPMTALVTMVPINPAEFLCYLQPQAKGKRKKQLPTYAQYGPDGSPLRADQFDSFEVLVPVSALFDDTFHRTVANGDAGLVEANLDDTLATLGKLNTKVDELNKLMDDSENVIVRSFESARGKGLAGVITSMDFQWLDQFTWEYSKGSVAPKACSVTINFAPIHDIGPGIDANGLNRAPIYNAGELVSKLGKDPYFDNVQEALEIYNSAQPTIPKKK